MYVHIPFPMDPPSQLHPQDDEDREYVFISIFSPDFQAYKGHMTRSNIPEMNECPPLKEIDTVSTVITPLIGVR